MQSGGVQLQALTSDTVCTSQRLIGGFAPEGPRRPPSGSGAPGKEGACDRRRSPDFVDPAVVHPWSGNFDRPGAGHHSVPVRPLRTPRRAVGTGSVSLE
jgi:hypothetical protein